MPTYLYRAASPEAACDTCREVFEVVRSMREPPLQACPSCEAALSRVYGSFGIARPKRVDLSDGNLKRLGFKKLVREGQGKYRDVLAE